MTDSALGRATALGPQRSETTVGSPSVVSEPFGTTAQGVGVDLYTLANKPGIEVSILTYGGIVQSIRVPDRAGETANVVLGFSELAPYLEPGGAYFGAVVGRYANRISNAAFVLDGRAHRLSQNEGKNHLHGGHEGFNKKVWRARPRINDTEAAVVLLHTSPACEEGYPGALEVEIVYSLTVEGVVRIQYQAVATEATVVSLTNHSLFNLQGEGSGSILEHELEINADRYTPIDAGLIPTGELAPVAGTPLDFRRPTKIGARIGDRFEQIVLAAGYDHNFVLNGESGEHQGTAARLVDGWSGRTLEIRTTEPGLQLYTGNRLDGTRNGTGGKPYVRFAGVALETQRFPDSPNKAHFPASVLRPGDRYRSTTELAFSVNCAAEQSG